MQKRLLFLITPAPPFEPGEEFLSIEVPFLAKTFEQIIVIHHSPKHIQKSSLGKSIELLYLPYLPSKSEKVSALLNVFKRLFWQELSQLLFHYKIFPSPQRLASALGAYTVGQKLKRLIEGKSRDYRDYKVYAYSYWCNFMAVGLALLKKHNPDITCICRAHGYDVYFKQNNIGYLPFRNLIYSSLDRVYFISNTGLEYASRKSGSFLSCRVSKLGSNRLDLQQAKHTGNAYHIVSCSSLISLKRVHLIVEALSLWTGPGTIHWQHFGSGPLLEQTMQYANKILEGNRWITFTFSGYINNQEVLEYYQRYTVNAIINVSESEGIPFSIIEAYSAGVPAIATRVGGVPEIVEHQKNGFLLPATLTASELYLQIVALKALSDVEKKKMSEAAFTTWLTYYNADINYPGFIKDFL